MTTTTRVHGEWGQKRRRNCVRTMHTFKWYKTEIYLHFVDCGSLYAQKLKKNPHLLQHKKDKSKNACPRQMAYACFVIIIMKRIPHKNMLMVPLLFQE